MSTALKIPLCPPLRSTERTERLGEEMTIRRVVTFEAINRITHPQTRSVVGA